MAIHSITKFQTWNVSQEVSINPITQKKDFWIANIIKDKKSIWQGLGNCLTLGGKLLKVINGIRNTLIRALFWINLKILSVLSAILKVIHEAKMAVNSVLPDVVIVGSHENIEKRSVYNLSVEDQHEYFANGILVSNCHATIYWRLALETKGEGKGGIKFWDVEDQKPSDIAPDLQRMAKKQEEFID
jgi:hypothetical protein